MALIPLFPKAPKIKNKQLRNIHSSMKNTYRIEMIEILKIWVKNWNIIKGIQNIFKVLPQKVFTKSAECRLPKKLCHKLVASHNVYFVMFNSTPSSRYCAPNVILPRWRRHCRLCRVSPWDSGFINVRFALRRSRWQFRRIQRRHSCPKINRL